MPLPTHVNRRALLALTASALAFAALPAQADRLSLSEISRYLNSLQSSRGAFTQINGDGSISTGTVSIKRPGRVRFDYNPPEQALVMAAGGEVAIFDRKTGNAERYPLGTTPLKFILQRNVNLQGAGIVTNHRFDGTSTVVTAQDPNHPEYGSIDMVFTGNPVQLRQWVMRTEGGETTVILGEMDERVQLPNQIFNIQSELAKGGN